MLCWFSQYVLASNDWLVRFKPWAVVSGQRIWVLPITMWLYTAPYSSHLHSLSWGRFIIIFFFLRGSFFSVKLYWVPLLGRNWFLGEKRAVFAYFVEYVHWVEMRCIIGLCMLSGLMPHLSSVLPQLRHSASNLINHILSPCSKFPRSKNTALVWRLDRGACYSL